MNSMAPDIPATTLPALADEAAARFGEQVLWESIDDGATLSFNGFRLQTLQCAAALRGLGVGMGSHVAVMLPNTPAYVVTWFALARLGAVMVPLNTRSASRELEYVLRGSDAEFLIVDAAYASVRDGIAGLHAWLPRSRIVVHGGVPAAGSWHARVNAAPASPVIEPRLTPETRMSIQYTSGSSGLPKGCVLTQDYWVLLGHVRSRQGPPPRRVLIDKPLSYMGGMWRFLVCLCLGSTACVARQFSLSGLHQRLTDHRIDFFSATDGVAKLPHHPGLAALNMAWISISGLNKDLHQSLEARFHAPVRELYGLTETGSTLFMPSDAAHMSGSGSCGLPAPYRVCRIVGADGHDVTRGTAGELWVRGRGILLEYYRNAEATAEAFADGWFRTGDLFVQDAAGYYYIQGRIKDSIRRSGENISAREVESIAAGIEGVLECAAVGVRDELRGQEVKLCLVLQPGVSASSVSPARVIAHCAEKLAAFKVPRYVEYFADLPRTSSGKIAKQDLVKSGATLFDRAKPV
jgi:acyl-CoA synthetase (AMP-forming)/AMP-acid ligase II